MPITPDRTLLEFYVYRFFLGNGKTFYVGKGHWPHWPPGQKWHRANHRGKFVSGIMEKSVDWSRKKKELQVIKRLHFDFGKIIYWEFLDARFPIGAPEHHIHPRMLMDVCSRKLMTDAQVMTDSDTAEGNEKKLIFEYANGGCYLANDRTNPHKRGINAIIGYVMDGSASDDSPDWQELEF